ncbi:YqjF family protein [Dyadobacter sp. NIV53]|uniref:YqjF family protein n=1 Tax=Dyadobacter sp. NIV53 TaxID=2861765 RepID=UPI001C88B982|nr:DUF2071 domain-containing protein [Dyadobacter sp. NIV53]
MTNFLTAQWENLIMANYAVPPEVLAPYLPKGVELDFYQGKTYVSLVGFLFRDTRIFGVPIPILGTFEEVNLRFYVTRKVGNEIKRGVVFINETVPSKLVAWVANYLYKEHYVSIPTSHTYNINPETKQIRFEWNINREWNAISVEAGAEGKPMEAGSIEEFIFEHYYGYTRIDDTATEEYNIHHDRWLVNDVTNYEINCNFAAMYGKDFDFLKGTEPDSVMLAEGSLISVKWKRNRI